MSAVTMAAPVEADAELIKLCAEFDRLEHACDALFEGVETVEQERKSDRLSEPLREQQDTLAERIIAHRATTIEGFRARARSVAIWDKQFTGGWHEGVHCSIAHSILRDLLGVGE